MQPDVTQFTVTAPAEVATYAGMRGLTYEPAVADDPRAMLTERARPMIDYLKMFEKSANVFPGFEAEVQGLYREVDEKGAIRFYTYVVRE